MDVKNLSALGISVADSPEELNAMEAEKNKTEDAPVEQPKQEETPQEKPKSEEAPKAQESSLNKAQEQTPEESSFGEVIDLDGGNTGETPTQVDTGGSPDFLAMYNERFGTSYKSEDEIQSASKPSDEITEQAAALNKWLKETGRPATDFFQTQLIDYNQFDDRTLVIQSLMQQGANREQAEAMLDSEYGVTRIDEDMMTDDEIKSAKRKNSALEFKLKKEANKIRSEFNELKEKYKAPMDGWKPQSETQEATVSPEEKEAWRKQMDASKNSLQSLQFELNDGKAFKFSTKDLETMNADYLSDPELTFNTFVGEDGEWDTTKVLRAKMLEENFDTIAKNIYNYAFGQGQKTAVSAGKNLSYDKSGRPPQNQETTTREQNEKQAFETIKNFGSGSGMSIKF